MPIHLYVAPDPESVVPGEGSLPLDIEAVEFLLDAASALDVAGLSPLEKLDPYEDIEFQDADLSSLRAGLPALRERLTEEFAKGHGNQRVVPPSRVGFLDLSKGLPFGREGVLRLLIELEDLVERAYVTNQLVCALGD